MAVKFNEWQKGRFGNPETFTLLCYSKCFFMDAKQDSLEALQDIRRMMERSSRFISLSGWSGVAAGFSALLGAWLAHQRILQYRTDKLGLARELSDYFGGSGPIVLIRDLCWIAAGTFLLAFLSAFLFTYIRSRKQGLSIWDRSAQRLVWNTLMPMGVGGIFILRALQLNYYDLVAPGCLLFYGLALVNASRYAVGEIRYLGYTQLLLGILCLWNAGHGIFFWSMGFGVMHIVYGGLMWWKYERGAQSEKA
jgi:hypothetical protein